ncbi:hypothetical protein B0G38_000655 [Arthrobacter sp. VKM Ac-2550]|nr:hypothetical protein [Arthrobacter sp. VKM Ac-2550]
MPNISILINPDNGIDRIVTGRARTQNGEITPRAAWFRLR